MYAAFNSNGYNNDEYDNNDANDNKDAYINDNYDAYSNNANNNSYDNNGTFEYDNAYDNNNVFDNKDAYENNIACDNTDNYNNYDVYYNEWRHTDCNEHHIMCLHLQGGKPNGGRKNWEQKKGINRKPERAHINHQETHFRPRYSCDVESDSYCGGYYWLGCVWIGFFSWRYHFCI